MVRKGSAVRIRYWALAPVDGAAHPGIGSAAMTTREPAREALTERLPEAPETPRPTTAGSMPLLGGVAAAGNRSLARAVAAGTVPRGLVAPTGRVALARAPTITPAPRMVATQRELSENDKNRLRSMVVSRLRGAVVQLREPKKSDIPRIARHLKPLPSIVAGFAADGEAGATLDRVAGEVGLTVQALDSSAGAMKPAIFRAVARWQSAQRHLGAARSHIQGDLAALNRQKPGQADPEGVDREQMIQDMTHLKAMQAQVGAAIKDLAEAPRNQEGLAEALELNVGILEELATLTEMKPAGAASRAEAAEADFEAGVAVLAPHSMARDDFLREARQSLQRAANDIAALVGESSEEVEPDPDPDTPVVDPTPPPDPAPSPNPLPPPPPPPPK